MVAPLKSILWCVIRKLDGGVLKSSIAMHKQIISLDFKLLGKCGTSVSILLVCRTYLL